MEPDFPSNADDSQVSQFPRSPPEHRRQNPFVASYAFNERAVARAERLIRARQYVLNSNWGDVQPNAEDENAFLASHSWREYAEWHLALTEGAAEETKARYAFVYGDFRRLHRMGLIACHYRAVEWRHKEIELAAHDLLQLLDGYSACRGSHDEAPAHPLGPTEALLPEAGRTA
jgi:hypothetical protein